MKRSTALWIVFCLLTTALRADDKPRVPVILDTDIGTHVDDAFALGLILAIPELELKGVTTVGGQAEDRAWIVCRFLTQTGNGHVPVAFGRNDQPDYGVGLQHQYRYHPAVIYNRTLRPGKLSAVDFLKQQLDDSPTPVTIIATGPLTNIARLVEQHPECRPKIARIIFAGGRGRPEWNVAQDLPSARVVLQSHIRLLVAPFKLSRDKKFRERKSGDDKAGDTALTASARQQIFAACTKIGLQIQNLHQLSDGELPDLSELMAVRLAADPSDSASAAVNLQMTKSGLSFGPGQPNARVAQPPDAEAFGRWIVRRLTAGSRSLPREPKNLSTLVPRGGLPRLVHAFEDYETDIERRWWLTGRAETERVANGKRSCRGILTLDFDGKMGDLGTSHMSVVFNPVPGPPMGKNTRLSFRYWLKGTDTLRVQLYSLSNGYHRYLALRGLPQGRWETATVDMTQMRRPDGSGGPLAEDERIDDIQYYCDPRAELFIDDTVLFDAALDESRPFPKRVVYTGWFDTGRHGREWPGDFEIVLNEKPRTWDSAKSVINQKTGLPWLRLSFRGRRPVGSLTRVRFEYLRTGDGPLRLELTDTQSGRIARAELATVGGKWQQVFVDFDTAAEPDAGGEPDAAGKTQRFADELRLLLPKGSNLLIDNVLVYEPGVED